LTPLNVSRPRPRDHAQMVPPQPGTRSPIRRCLGIVLVVVAALVACGGGVGGSGDGIVPFYVSGAVVVTDLDGDGRQDVAVALAYVAGPPPHPGYVDVYLSNGPGRFAAPVRLAVGPDPWGLAAGDFDGDGLADLAAATPTTTAPEFGRIADDGVLSLLVNDRARPGTFRAARIVATGGVAYDAAIAELTGDGLADLVVADNVTVNRRALLLAQVATPAGALATPISLALGIDHGASTVVAGDVNGDGLADVVLAANGGVVLLVQRAGGGFEPAITLATGTAIQGVALADLDGDGRTDVVATDAGNAPGGGTGGSRVVVLLQGTPGRFSTASLTVADGARRVAVGDLDGDGVPDLAVLSIVYQAQDTPSQVSVLLQSSANRGQFALPAIVPGTSNSSFLAIGEVTGDGRNDIVLGEGPSVLAQRADRAGSFEAVRALR
jgi:hypothetical protein